MRITAPRGDVVPGRDWEFSWSDVHSKDGPLVNFWLTHYAHPPAGIHPRLLNEHPVDCNKHHTYEVQGSVDLTCGNGYRIWAMKVGETPEKEADPIAESEDFNVRCKADIFASDLSM
ncbi:hypothetical protein BJX99DRAFT_218481 [Aspergillus californicus]